MIKKIVIALLMLCMVTIYAQDKPASEENDDKYTVVNIMLNQIFQCSEGLILKYRANNENKIAYIPNKFFRQRIAVKVDEEDTNISPQMNLILKNGKPHRVKLYLASKASNMTYRLMEFVTADTRSKFKMDELQIEY